jgi:hypothetical protein
MRKMHKREAMRRACHAAAMRLKCKPALAGAWPVALFVFLAEPEKFSKSGAWTIDA